jgi:hypothetical protein
MKVIIVVDNPHSALFIAASARAQVLGAEVVCANNFLNTGQLFRYLVRKEPSIVLFSWRSALFDASKSLRFRKNVNELHQISRIGVLIPDHLGLHASQWGSENKCLLACDFYLVTSEILHNEYSSRMCSFPPIGILHDLPNLDLIKEVAKKYPKIPNKKPKIIWVGNSQWGKRFGFKDHKGLKNIVRPLGVILSRHNACMELEIIDSSRKRLSQFRVLRKIRNSDILIQVSASEGTGLPILEAIGLGTEILSTPVGVFGELFENTDLRLLNSITAESIHLSLHQLLETRIADSHKSSIAFQRYIEEILLEEIPLANKRKIEFLTTNRLKTRVKIEFIWFLRFVKFKASYFLISNS